MQTRRHFVTSSAAALLAAASTRFLAAQPLPDSELFSNAALGALQQGLLTQARFESVTGTLFMLFVDEEHVDYMHLQEVRVVEPILRKTSLGTASGKKILAPLTSSFLLIFKTTKVLAEQGSYMLDHGTLGRFTLFLVPSQTSSGQSTCICTFNYLAQSSIAAAPILAAPGVISR